MKKLIPLVLGVWIVAMVGCTTAQTTTTTRTTQKQTNAPLDPTLENFRSSDTQNMGPR